MLVYAGFAFVFLPILTACYCLGGIFPIVYWESIGEVLGKYRQRRVG